MDALAWKVAAEANGNIPRLVKKALQHATKVGKGSQGVTEGLRELRSTLESIEMYSLKSSAPAARKALVLVRQMVETVDEIDKKREEVRQIIRDLDDSRE